MPNFTDGEWKYEPIGRAFALTDGNGLSLLTVHEEDTGKENEWGDSIPTPFGAVYCEADARLMAQSKKMYADVLQKLDAWWRLPNVDRTIEAIEPIMRSTLDILSEIDKE